MIWKICMIALRKGAAPAVAGKWQKMFYTSAADALPFIARVARIAMRDAIVQNVRWVHD